MNRVLYLFLVMVRAAISALTAAISALYFTKYTTADRVSLNFEDGVLGVLSMYISCNNFIMTQATRWMISIRALINNVARARDIHLHQTRHKDYSHQPVTRVSPVWLAAPKNRSLLFHSSLNATPCWIIPPILSIFLQVWQLSMCMNESKVELQAFKNYANGHLTLWVPYCIFSSFLLAVFDSHRLIYCMVI